MLKMFLTRLHDRLHGITAKRSNEWPKVEKDFREKNPTCAACGSTNKLNVHHKKPFHLHPELELDENNLITLCMDKNRCHLLIGHGDNFRAYNPNVEADAAKVKKDIKLINEVAAMAEKNRLTE